MADRLDGRTTRLYTDFIAKPSYDIRFVSSEVNLSRKNCSVLGIEPIRHELTNGIQPNIWSLRLAFDPTGEIGARNIVDFVNYEKVLKFFTPSKPTAWIRSGFSADVGDELTLLPISLDETTDVEKRLLGRLTVPTQLPYIEIWDNSTVNGSMYLGKYWLSNVSCEGFEGVVLTFADARARNYEKPIVGKYLNYSQSLRYTVFGSVVFNPDGEGNMAPTANTGTGKHLFQEDWKGSLSIPLKLYKWTCWDMLLYLFDHDLAIEIEEPDGNDPEWTMWNAYAGWLTPEVDITGMTVTEAIDTIIKASGDFNWTLLAPPDDSGKWRLKPYHYSRYSNFSYSGATNTLDGAMKSHVIYLPTRGQTLDGSKVSISHMTCDEQSSKRVGHLIMTGDPIVIESTFSTDGANDYSCYPRGVVYSAGAGSGIATMEWVGNEAAFQTGYGLVISDPKQKRIQTAEAADDVAYRVCCLKRGLSSTTNPNAGFAFAPNDGSWIEQRREFLGYRLPQASTNAADPGEQNLKPEVIVWIRKPADSGDDTKWILAGSKPDKYTGGYTVDPVTGGIRFNNPMVDLDTWDKFDVRVTACVELDERVMIEISRKDFEGKSVYIPTSGKYRLGIRWNAVMLDEVLANGNIVDDTDELADECKTQFADFDRVRRSAVFTIPWTERIYNVGDWIGTLRSGETATQNPLVHQRTVEMPVVGVVIDVQNQTTQISVENWKQ